VEIQPEEIYTLTLGKSATDQCLALISIRTYDEGNEYVHQFEGRFGSLMKATEHCENMFFAWINGGHIGTLSEAHAHPMIWYYLNNS
jgi:hypothetical protein